MTRGRKRTPTGIRLLEGNVGHRPLNEHEPKPRPISPQRPDFLSPVAKRHWTTLMDEYEHIPGLLSRIDVGVVAGLCESFSQWRDAVEKLHKHGPVIVAQGQVRASPYVKIARDAMAAYLRAASEIGATPAARTRIQVKPGGEDDDDLLDKPARTG